MPDKPPADRTVTAPSDAAPRTAEARSADALLKHIGGLLQRRPWYQLPRLLAYGKLVEIRNELREKNLHDTEEPPLEKQAVPPPISIRPFARRARPTAPTTIFSIRAMGAVGCRFGRNVPLEHTVPDTANLLVPNPRTVSRELMTREQFQPATILNLLAAAWIQFMVHDWFVHKRSKTEFLDIPTAPGDDWGAPSMQRAALGARPGAGRLDASAGLRQPEQPLVGRVADLRLRSRRWPPSCARRSAASCASSRPDCCRSIPTPACTSPASPTTGGSAWRCCTRSSRSSTTTSATCSRTSIRDWTDEQLFRKAKLINSALMAKIHTVEWTPAIVPHPIITDRR